MVNSDVAHNLVGIIGNVVTFVMYISPTPTFITIIRKKSVGEFSPLPYKTGMKNCAFWLLYTFYKHPIAPLLITVSFVGFFLQLLYLFIFALYTDPVGRGSIGFVLYGTAFALFCLGVVCRVTFYEDMEDVRSLLLEIMSCLVNIGMYAAPLFILFDALGLSSVKYMSFTLSLAMLLNAAIWTSYALIKFDMYALITNVLGLISGVLQLVLHGSNRFSGVKVSAEITEVGLV